MVILNYLIKNLINSLAQQININFNIMSAIKIPKINILVGFFFI